MVRTRVAIRALLSTLTATVVSLGLVGLAVPASAVAASIALTPTLVDTSLPLPTVTVDASAYGVDFTSLPAGQTLLVRVGDVGTYTDFTPAVVDADTVTFPAPSRSNGSWVVNLAVMENGSPVVESSSNLSYADPFLAFNPTVASTSGGTAIGFTVWDLIGYNLQSLPDGVTANLSVGGADVAFTASGPNTGTFTAPTGSGTASATFTLKKGAATLADATGSLTYMEPGDMFSMTQRHWACDSVVGTDFDLAATTDCVEAVQFRPRGGASWTEAELDKAYGDISGADDPPANPASYLPGSFNPDNLEYWVTPGVNHEAGTNFDGSSMDPADAPRVNMNMFVVPIDGGQMYLNLSLQAHSGYVVRDPVVERCNAFNAVDPAGTNPCIRPRDLNPDYEYRVVLRISRNTFEGIALSSRIQGVIADVELIGDSEYRLTIEGGVRASQWIADWNDPESHNWADGIQREWSAAVFPVGLTAWQTCFGKGVIAGSTNGIAAGLFWDAAAQRVGVSMIGRHLDVPADPVAGPGDSGVVFAGNADVSLPVELAQCMFPGAGISSSDPLGTLEGSVLNQPDATITQSFDDVTGMIQVRADGFTFSQQYLALTPVAADTETPGSSSGSASPPAALPAAESLPPTAVAPAVVPAAPPGVASPPAGVGPPAAVPAVGLSKGGVPAILRPLAASTPPAGSSWIPSSVRLVPYKAPRTPVTVKETRSGTWRVNIRTGAITFDPATGFRGEASMGYRVRATDGSQYSSFVTVVVRK